MTAVFSSNDQMALGLLHAIRDAGLDVPGDISVVGFDDIPEAAHFWPPLTTVRQDFGELGRRCIALLLADIDGITSPVDEVVQPQLIVRASTARPSSPLAAPSKRVLLPQRLAAAASAAQQFRNRVNRVTEVHPDASPEAVSVTSVTPIPEFLQAPATPPQLDSLREPACTMDHNVTVHINERTSKPTRPPAARQRSHRDEH